MQVLLLVSSGLTSQTMSNLPVSKPLTGKRLACPATVSSFPMKPRFYTTYLESATSKCLNLLLLPENYIAHYSVILNSWSTAELIHQSTLDFNRRTQLCCHQIHGTTVNDGPCWLPRNTMCLQQMSLESLGALYTYIYIMYRINFLAVVDMSLNISIPKPQ